jgi:hypothetical protein
LIGGNGTAPEAITAPNSSCEAGLGSAGASRLLNGALQLIAFPTTEDLHRICHRNSSFSDSAPCLAVFAEDPLSHGDLPAVTQDHAVSIAFCVFITAIDECVDNRYSFTWTAMLIFAETSPLRPCVLYRNGRTILLRSFGNKFKIISQFPSHK